MSPWINNLSLEIPHPRHKPGHILRRYPFGQRIGKERVIQIVGVFLIEFLDVFNEIWGRHIKKISSVVRYALTVFPFGLAIYQRHVVE